MNKNCYKVIFNQHKGCMTAVPEYASRHSKYSADRTSSSSISRFGIKQFAFFMMAAVGTAWVLPSQAADIQADRHAPANQQPVVLQTANGLPQVNIQTPTTGGVSVNQYQQFDVSRRGAILNNSRRNTQTRLGGWIQGNPMLAGGEARIIVNQVNSSNPSLLNGYIETAGKRAEVVIANPSGIQVDGGGFINAAGVTLTTGKPLIGNGGLEGFQVREGRVSVSGEGLDGSTADYTRILTQAAEINGRVWAKDLNITAGRFDMAADGSVQAAGSGENSETAIDTGVLGGMYAGKITLTATDKGVGVNNAGEIYASAGSVVLSADGKISNSGRIIGKGDTAVNARSLDNSGALSSQNTADIQTASLSNSGMIASAKEARIRNSGKFDNSGKLNAARLDVETASLANSGEISQSGAQSLNIEAKHAENTGLIGYRDTASIPNTDSSNAHSQSSATGSADSAASSFGNQSNPQPKQASGRLKISDGLGNSGDITANGVTHLNINSGFNNRKDIKVGKFTQQTGRFDNSANFYAAEATIQADRAANSGTWAAASADITAGELDNSGSVQANALNINAKLSNTDTIEAGSLNIDGNIRNSGRLNTDRITARSQTLDNSQGRITAHQSGSLTVSDGLNNDGGQIHSQGNLDIGDNRADTLEVRNNQGSILAGNDLNIQAKSLDNSGTTRANRDTVIKLKESFANSKTLESGRLLSLESAGTISNSGTLRGGRSLKVKAAALHNHGTAESGSDTRLEAENTLVNTGLANSGGLTAVKGRDIDNSGRIYGDHVAVGGENLRNRENSSGKAGVIAARRHLAIGAKKIDNIGSGFDKIVEGKQQLGNASSLIASLGTLSIGGRLNDAYHAEGKAQTLNNRGAKIESVGDMDLSVDSIRNVNNRLEIEEKVAEGESRYVKAYSLPGNAEWWVEGKDGHFWQTGDDAKGQFDFKDGRRSLKYKVWNEKEVTIRTHADLLVHSEPGQIIAGGNFKVDTNNLLNKDSQILIGGRWHGESKNSVLDNDSIAQKRYEVETGRGWQSYSHKSKKDLKFKWVRRGRGDYGINSTRYLPEQAFGNDFEHYQENSTFSTQIGNIESANNRTKSADITANQTGSVRTLNADPRLPNSALFAVNPDHPTHLVETDPAFTDYKQWLSGDYMLKALAVDPASTHKRLGDGYYEQRLVNEQIAKLTGYRRLDGYGSDEEQFKALMDAGITVAKQFNLVPGIALTSEQVALLTSDILWLENQTVTLADGSTKTVLAPKVYTVVRKGDLNAAGGLISASAIALKAENIDNQGTLGTRETVRLDAQNIRLGGNVASSAVVATASDGLKADGKVEAANLIALKGKDITIESSTASAGDERNGSTSLNRQAGLHLNGSQGGRGMVAVDASGKLSINGADIRNAASDGLTVLQGKDVHIGTVQTETREAYGELSDNIHRHARIRKEHGSRIEAAGDIRIFSDGQTDIRQAEIASSKGKVTVYGKDGVSVAEGRKQSSADEAYTSKKNKIVSKTTSEIRKQSDYDEAVGSSLQGKEVYIGSQGGILVRGSEVVSDNKTVIDGKNVTLEAAVNAYQNNSDIRTKKSGFSGRLGKKGVQIGYNRHRSETENDGITQDVSTANIGSIGGDTVIRATDTLATRAAVVGSGGNLILEGKNIDIGSLY
uniref:two-partner secretion domain-containing protein n=1 Tax=Neisseria weaveri TaxID=28091 RepID=UPI000D305496